MQKIILSVTNDLATDQRVEKVCNSLKEEGYKIVLIGRKLKNSPKINKNFTTKRMRLIFNKGFFFYAEYNLRLFFYLLFHKKDILLSNDLDTLLPNYLVAKLSNKKLIYDSHELFTEVPELINRPTAQKIWLKLESAILPKLQNCYTVSDAIATHYNEKYKTDFKIIRNVPKLKNRTSNYHFPFNKENKKIILYQGALNVGRGLELMIETMQYLDNAIFVLIGSGDITKKLQSLVKQEKLDNKIQFLGRISPEELKKITPKADLGISLEEDLGLSYHFALPNKIFDYIHGEIPVLASNLPEMKKIIVNYKVGEIVTNRNPKHVAKQIFNLLNRPKTEFIKPLKKAKKELNWQKESKKLLDLFKTT